MLGYVNLEFSARTRTACVCLEAIAIAAYIALVLAKGGPGGVRLARSTRTTCLWERRHR